MKRLVILAALLCLLATSALAANVTVYASGIAPGSNYHIFTYDPNDAGPTVVDKVLPNDLIKINYQGPKQQQSLTYLFKNQADNWWDYTVFQQYNDMLINISERVPIDLYGDGNVELYMEFTNLTYMRYGTFTFYPAAAPAAPANETAPANASAPSNETAPATQNGTPAATANATNGTLVGNDRDAHGCIASAGYSWCESLQKCLRPWEEQCPAAAPAGNASNATAPAAPPADQGEFPWGLITILVVIFAAIGLYIYLMRDKEEDADEEPKKGKKEKEDEAKEEE